RLAGCNGAYRVQPAATGNQGQHMEFFRIRRTIPFMRHALIFNVISFATFFAAVFFIWQKGLHLSIEFTGGTVMEVSYSQPAELAEVRVAVASLGYTDSQVQNFGTSRDVMIRLPLQKTASGAALSTAQQSEQVMSTLKARDASVELKRVEF